MTSKFNGRSVGTGRRPRHVIAETKYGPMDGPSWTLCACGTRLTAPTPEKLAKAFSRHTGK